MEKNQMTKVKTVMTEEDYVNILTSTENNDKVDLSILLEEDKTKIESLEQEIVDFLKDNSKFDSYTEADKDALFKVYQEKYKNYRNAIKNARCHFVLNASEISFMHKKLSQSIDYDAHTIFYALHIKRFVLNELPKKTEMYNNDLTISLTNSVMLYHLLSKCTSKGINADSYSFAFILQKLVDISKIYEKYDVQLKNMDNNFNMWNLGLSLNEDEKKALENKVEEEVANAK